MEKLRTILKNLEVVWRIFGRLLAIGFVLLQGLLLDRFLVEYNGGRYWYLFIIIDVINAITISGCLVLSFTAIRKIKDAKKMTDEQGRPTRAMPRSPPVPFPWAAYTFYVATVVLRVCFLFSDIDNQLRIGGKEGKKDTDVNNIFLSKNLLKTSVALTALVFMFFVLCHHNAINNIKRKIWINVMSGSVTIDVLDTVELMDLLFEDDARDLPNSLINAIMVFACINLMVPCIALLDLSRTNYGCKDPNPIIHIIFVCAALFGINIPFFTIRMVIWHGHLKNVSILLIKNIIGIALQSRELFHLTLEVMDAKAQQALDSSQPSITDSRCAYIEKVAAEYEKGVGGKMEPGSAR